jgi:hypothetical protein
MLNTTATVVMTNVYYHTLSVIYFLVHAGGHLTMISKEKYLIILGA